MLTCWNDNAGIWNALPRVRETYQQYVTLMLHKKRTERSFLIANLETNSLADETEGDKFPYEIT